MPAPLSRRTLLRGAGAALALPHLEAMLPRLATAPPPPPVRLCWIYVPNGVHVPSWRPGQALQGKERRHLARTVPAFGDAPGGAGTGALRDALAQAPWVRDLEAMPASLASLEPLRARVSLHLGLTAHTARANGDGPGDHARAAAAWLTGVQPLKDGGQVRLGVSADQLAARRVGERTLYRSLVLGTEVPRLSGQCDSGYACAYQSHLSWEGAETPAAKETRPARAFDRLFRGEDGGLPAAVVAERRARRRSVLDLVRGEARSLSARLAPGDRQRLDEYLTGLREVERRIAHAETLADLGVPDEARPVDAPADLGEHARALLDVVRLAFESDVTRFATVMLANEGSNRAYREVGVRAGHHEQSHHGDDPDKLKDVARIDRYLADQLAHFLGTLADTPEGEGDLLGHSLVLYGSGIEDGNRHAHHDLPVLLAGEGGGARGGRVVSHVRDTPLCDLHRALLERAGVPFEPGEVLGDGHGALPGV